MRGNDKMQRVRTALIGAVVKHAGSDGTSVLVRLNGTTTQSN